VLGVPDPAARRPQHLAHLDDVFRGALFEHRANPMRVVAIDPGARRVGIAVSDESAVIAQPLRSISVEPADTLVDRLMAVISETGSGEVVVGLPRRLDGALGPEAAQARQLADELRRRTRLRVELVDERLTTAMAEKAMIAGGLKRGRRRHSVDAVAAALILETYLATRKRDA
jgi:putative Holliday junction resolvase